MSTGGGAVVADDNTTTSAFTQFSHSLWRRYQHVLDKSTPLVLYRWIFLAAIAFIYAVRVYLIEGFYIITYGLGIYILQLLIAFLSPMVDPEIQELSDAPSLPTRGSDEFRPFVRRLPEFKFWHSLAKAFCIAFVLTFFSAFDVPVFWPILLFYWLVLFIATMKRQLLHMIKYKYVPFTFGKQRYGKRVVSNDETSTSRWDHGGGLLDRAKGNKWNWILVWEDGFCDFIACERSASGYDKGIRFGADVFFKLSHEVYNYGEGLVGKIASDNSHKWVFSDSEPQNDPSFITSWNVSIDPRPRAWEAQFSSGIETIAIISVREGAIQLGSFDKAVEDLNLVLSIQRKFSYLQSIPGMYTLQRPYFPISLMDYHNSRIGLMKSSHGIDSKPLITRLKRQKYEQNDEELPSKTMYLGHNCPQNRVFRPSPLYSIPPIFPSMSFNLGASCGVTEAADQEDASRDIGTGNVKSGISENAVVDQIWGIDLKVEKV